MSAISTFFRAGWMVAALGLVFGCTSREAHQGAEWSYAGERGPTHWAELDPDYVLAAVGGSQSPIDIVTEEVITADLPAVSFESRRVPLKMRNSGHTVEVLAPGGSTLRYGKHEFVLTQYHFHSPSEHTIDGRHAAAELHFVHTDGAGQLAVVGILVEEGAEDYPFFLPSIETHAPEEPGEVKAIPEAPLHTAHLFDGCDEYFMYDGSLTTPPATEGVRWFVCAEPRVISTHQLDLLRNLYTSTNRPIQPAHARIVLRPRRR